jgi:hypothetical protein
MNDFAGRLRLSWLMSLPISCRAAAVGSAKYSAGDTKMT